MRDVIKIYFQPAFLICAATLAAAAGGMPMMISGFEVYLKKEPIPLKKSLDLLDERELASYKVVSKEKIENEEVIKSLGTEDYIQWVLDDADAPADSPVRKCLLFVTYYKLPDQVPHVPEECYVGSGYQRLSSDAAMVEIDKQGGSREIPVRHLVFTGAKSGSWGINTEFSVLYLFNVDGIYANSREDVRLALVKNIRGRHSYFCKVEWQFFNIKFDTKIYPSKEDAIAASQKLLGTILPVLEKEHWPDREN